MKLRILCVLLCLAGCGGISLNDGQVRIGTSQSVQGGDVQPDIYVFGSETGDVIKKPEMFQITLISGHICDFREQGGIFNSPAGFATTNDAAIPCKETGHGSVFQGKATRGEIAVLAGFQFRGVTANQPDLPEERLVYFSDDVRETGQLLNFQNIPIYGPAPAKLASAQLRMTILELDQDEAKKQSEFLGTLASAGAVFASPVQGAAIGVLSSIGSALILSNKDDREFRVDLGFDAPNVGSDVPRLLLREGYLALVRRENRSATDHFVGPDMTTKLVICPTRGYVALGDCEDKKIYRGSTWLLLRVSREDPEIVNAALSQTFQDLVDSRLAAVDISGLSSVSTELEALMKAIKDAEE